MQITDRLIYALPLRWRFMAAVAGFIVGLTAICVAGYLLHGLLGTTGAGQTVRMGTILLAAIWVMSGGALMMQRGPRGVVAYMGASEAELVELMELTGDVDQLVAARNELRRRDYFSRMQILARHYRVQHQIHGGRSPASEPVQD